MKRHRTVLSVLAILLCLTLASCASTGKASKAAEPVNDEYRNYYEIFVWSFFDTDNNGIGDLNGVRQKLPYIKDLGYNGIWLMPVTDESRYPSPSLDSRNSLQIYYRK